ncbi:MAG: hypothetical protein ABSB87_02600 [Terriglobales bacterium]|jgi:hypothetical protein
MLVGFKVMTSGSKILGLLLIAAVVIAPLTAGALADADTPLTGLTGRPSVCHMHLGGTPSDSNPPHYPRSVPASYQCCLAGHDAALMQRSGSPQPSAECVRITVQFEPALPSSSSGLESSILPSADPPGTNPLRI